MRDKEKVKENIIDTTTERIEQSVGMIDSITVLAIADRMGDSNL